MAAWALNKLRSDHVLQLFVYLFYSLLFVSSSRLKSLLNAGSSLFHLWTLKHLAESLSHKRGLMNVCWKNEKKSFKKWDRKTINITT